MNVGIFGEHHILVRFLLDKEVSGRWNYGQKIITSSFDNDCDPQ